MRVVPNPDLSGFLEEIDGIDERYRRLLELVAADCFSGPQEEQQLMSDWMAARHEVEVRMVELIQIHV